MPETFYWRRISWSWLTVILYQAKSLGTSWNCDASYILWFNFRCLIPIGRREAVSIQRMNSSVVLGGLWIISIPWTMDWKWFDFEHRKQFFPNVRREVQNRPQLVLPREYRLVCCWVVVLRKTAASPVDSSSPVLGDLEAVCTSFTLIVIVC